MILCALTPQATSASALSMKECKAKYKAAKSAATLNGAKWQDFRKAQCSAGSESARSHLIPHSGGGH